MNLVVLKGRLGQDPEIRVTASGKKVANLRLAVPDEANKETTHWLTVVAWEKSAEFIERFFHKGKEMLLTGRLQVREWEDKSRQKRTSVEVVASRVEFVGPKEAEGGRQEAAGSGQQSDEPFTGATDSDVSF